MSIRVGKAPLAALLLAASSLPGSAQLPAATSDPAPRARLGIILDVSAEMGFLVPQARKEIRWMNQTLVARGRQTLPVEELAGAGMDREGSLSVPARRNALYPFRALLEEKKVDGIYWLTSLRGQQSGEGLFALETLLKGGESGPSRRLTIRNIWQDQAQAAASWTRQPPPFADDPLAPENRPSEWYRLAQAGSGVIVRSWQVPPPDLMGAFGFPHRLSDPVLLRRLGIEEGNATMDTRWSQDLSAFYGFQFTRPGHTWPVAISGRRWLAESILVPHLDADTATARDAAVFESLCARDTIDEDLDRIDAKKVGVLFGFGYVKRDLDRFKTAQKTGRDWRSQYLGDLTSLVGEARGHAAAHAFRTDRAYATEYVELVSSHPKEPASQAFARRMARLVREEGVDAIYFFTNGYTGGGDYGTFRVNEPLIAAAIRDAGVKLHVRVPFELGVAPMDLQRLALASGGGVFLGKTGDEDWNFESPQPKWP